jgi:hypothetical protein
MVTMAWLSTVLLSILIDCAIGGSHGFLNMALLQFDRFCCKIGPVVDASLYWMDSPQKYILNV